jgi:hypothetical protein
MGHYGLPFSHGGGISVAAHERNIRGRSCVSYAASAPQGLEDAAVGVSDHLIVAISHRGERDSRRNRVMCIKPERYLSQLFSTSDQQAGADEENHGNRDFSDNQGSSHAIACAADRGLSTVPKPSKRFHFRSSALTAKKRSINAVVCSQSLVSA